MSAMLLKFTGLRAKCSECRRWFIRTHWSNEPAYCSYTCGAKAQPDSCITMRGGTTA